MFWAEFVDRHARNLISCSPTRLEEANEQETRANLSPLPLSLGLVRIIQTVTLVVVVDSRRYPHSSNYPWFAKHCNGDNTIPTICMWTSRLSIPSFSPSFFHQRRSFKPSLHSVPALCTSVDVERERRIHNVRHQAYIEGQSGIWQMVRLNVQVTCPDVAAGERVV